MLGEICGEYRNTQRPEEFLWWLVIPVVIFMVIIAAAIYRKKGSKGRKNPVLRIKKNESLHTINISEYQIPRQNDQSRDKKAQ